MKSDGTCQVSKSNWFQISHHQMLENIWAMYSKIEEKSVRTYSSILTKISIKYEGKIKISSDKGIFKKSISLHEKCFEEILQQNQNKSKKGRWHRNSSWKWKNNTIQLIILEIKRWYIRNWSLEDFSLPKC